MIKGLATVIYKAPDLDRAKAWYAKAFQTQPYFDQPFYVGFNIAGCELGLDPDEIGGKPGQGGVIAYWLVENIGDAMKHFLSSGATEVSAINDVGGGIKVANVGDPFGNVIGLIENPQFGK